MDFIFDDGGRQAAGWKALHVGDCVVRSIAIATQQDYQHVYDAFKALAKTEKITKRQKTRSAVRDGVRRETIKLYMQSIGWTWVPIMKIGTGCKMHMRQEELPSGRLVVSLSKHITAVIDGVIHDTADPSRGGTRCVYGYWCKE